MKKIIPYYLAKFFNDFILIYPFYTLLFRERGQSESQIAWLLVIWSLSTALLEIPTGILSDRHKRRTILLISLMCKAAAFILWIPDAGFFVIALGFILWGLSEALASGTEGAWLYETLASIDKHHEYARIRGRGVLLANIGVALSAPAGGVLSRWGMTPVLAVSAVTAAAAGICILFFADPPRLGMDAEKKPESDWKKELAAAGADIRSSPRVLLMIFFSACIVLVAGELDEWDALFLRELKFGTLFIGVWMSLRFLGEALGAAAAYRIGRVIPSFSGMFIFAGVWGIPLLLLGMTGNRLLLPFYCLFYFSFGALHILSESYIQNSIAGERRATVLSIKSMLDNSIGMGMVIAIGYAAELFSFGVVWAAAGLYILIGSGAFILAETLLPGAGRITPGSQGQSHRHE